MWDFEHPPLNATLSQRYRLNYTTPSRCADALLTNQADLGLVPIASLTSALHRNCMAASVTSTPASTMGKPQETTADFDQDVITATLLIL